jgi:hypothetical protein
MGGEYSEATQNSLQDCDEGPRRGCSAQSRQIDEKVTKKSAENWIIPKKRRKIVKILYLYVFEGAGSESDLSFAQKILDHALSNLRALCVRSCTRLPQVQVQATGTRNPHPQ